MGGFEDFINIGNTGQKEDSEFKDLLNELMSSKNIDKKTELSDNELKEINKLMFIAELTGYKRLRTYVLRFMRLRISLLRKGRTEFFNAIKPQENLSPQIQQTPNLVPVGSIQQQQERKRFRLL